MTFPANLLMSGLSFTIAITDVLDMAENRYESSYCEYMGVAAVRK